MRLENVFYGFTKDGKNRCLYKKYKVYETEYGAVNGTIYVDLENKREIEISQVDEDTLQPINTLLKGIRKTRRKIIKTYKKEMDISVNINHLFYGDIIYYFSPHIDCGYEDIDNVIKVISDRNVLFRGTSNGFAKDFKTGQDYFVINDEIKYVDVKKEFVDNTRRIKKDFRSSEKTKRRVLELDYRKEL